MHRKRLSSSRNIEGRTLCITHAVVIVTVVTIKFVTVVFVFVLTRVAYITVTLTVQKLSFFGLRLAGNKHGSQLYRESILRGRCRTSVGPSQSESGRPSLAMNSHKPCTTGGSEQVPSTPPTCRHRRTIFQSIVLR
jgi:hypothetical protein